MASNLEIGTTCIVVAFIWSPLELHLALSRVDYMLKATMKGFDAELDVNYASFGGFK